MSELVIERLKGKRVCRIPESTKLVLVGLTPGRVQHKAINEAHKPRIGAFKGQMRRRLFKWFGEIGINNSLGIVTEDDIFLENKFEKIIFLTSLLRDPVYYKNGKNYSGRNPVPWKDETLTRMANETLKLLKTSPSKALIVPCGDIVSKVLAEGLYATNLKENLLFGFPHPSPLNSHGDRKLTAKRKLFRKKVKVLL